MENGSRHRVSFGLFEADPISGELWKSGIRVRIQSQPFRVLITLVERPGEVVTREELHDQVWGKDTNIDFDRALSIAINKVRDALGDNAENPRFIETLARRGYRFIAPVSKTASANDASAPPAAIPAHKPQPVISDMTVVTSQDIKQGTGFLSRIPILLIGIAVILGLTVAAILGYRLGADRSAIWIPELRQVTNINRIRPAWDSLEDFATIVSDGRRLFATAVEAGRSSIVQVSIPDGGVQTLSAPDEIGSVILCDISPDGSRLLVRGRSSNESEQPLWILPIAGGSAERVSVLAHDASWMPDGAAILYAVGNTLRIMNLRDNQSRTFATLPGRAFWMRWSPDGKRMRFTLLDPISHEQSIWESNDTGTMFHPLLPRWSRPANECCGNWTPDGSVFLFQAIRNKNSDIWMLSNRTSQHPRQLTNGPMLFEGPIALDEGKRAFFTGIDLQSQLEVFSPAAREFVPYNGFLNDAQRLEVSRDHRWIAWTDLNGRLWRSRADGSERLQLTPGGLHVFLARWSPDGTWLAFMARAPGMAWQIYLVRADGTDLHPLKPESRNQADPAWSADGRSIAFGRVPDLMGHENATRNIEVIDLARHQPQMLQDSENLFSPRWSPDGRWIAAMSLDQQQLRLYDTVNRIWRIFRGTEVADPVWSADSMSIYAQSFNSPGEPIIKLDVTTGAIQTYATRSSPEGDRPAQFFFCGLLAGDIPVIQSRRETANIYSLDLQGNR
jgi:Tol biopolymer transport system component/DNA-binding winged helix-turn-helix (wHTH) protein